jgi:hypothetical protein
VTSLRPSVSRELVVRHPWTPFVHVGTARPRISQSHAVSMPDPTRHACSHVRHRRRGPPTHVGSVVAQPLQSPQPHGIPGNREIGRARMGPAAAAGSYMVATPAVAPRARPAMPALDPPARKAIVTRSGSATRAGSTARNRCRAETLIRGGLG